MQIPHFEIGREIGRGANAIVYEAQDTLLRRSVAIKIWNEHGQLRAQSETAKIAGLSHPLIVTTHIFGILDGHPYAVMELIPGVSGKEWLKSSPTVQTRVTVWKMYVRALRHLHSTGMVHGDPHLGNIIVFKDSSEIYSPRNWRSEPEIAMKLADTGTSELWENHDDFASREAKLIHETAKRMFSPERFDSLAFGISGLGYTDTLAACDAVVAGISAFNALPIYEARSLVANKVVEIALKTPVFNLDELFRQACESQTTESRRVFTRLNGALLGLRGDEWIEADGEVTSETISLYRILQEQWRSEVELRRVHGAVSR